MANLAITYQNIADILSFDLPESDLEHRLSKPSFDWDAIVVEGSKHLVLPTIFCRLEAKGLTHLMPEELYTYLNELTQLNKNRNLAIIDQIDALSETLNSHNIDHVFLKGAALLVGDFYKNNAERMLGDIDILVAEEQLNKAYEILLNEDYIASDQTFGHDFFEHKHLPRLKTEKHICAVELHKKLFVSFKDKVLTNSQILQDKTTDKSIYVPSINHLIRHNILNYQINDQGGIYNSISFRSAYDSLVLIKSVNYDFELDNAKIFRKYINIIGLFFKDLSHLKPEHNAATSFYIFKLKHIKFYKLWNKLVANVVFLKIVMGRIPHFLFNKAYRTAVLKDRSRIIRHFRSVFGNSTNLF